jgi:uncharacterized protein (DUF58 family)
MGFRGIFNTNPGSAEAKTSLLSTPLLRLLDHLALNTDPLLPRQSSGARTSAIRKPASEFREHRAYAPGDDVRYVDWKASARQEHIFIKQNADPKAELVYLLLDCSASMAWGDPPKSGAALALAGLLGYLALAHQDRLLVVPVTAKPGHPLGPLWGKGQAALLERYLQALPFGGQVDMARTLAGLPQRRLSQGGLVLVVSDLLGAQFRTLAKALATLPAPAWKVVFCHLLHPAELNPAIHGYFEMLDIETGQKKQYPVTDRVLELYRQRLQAWRDQIAQACQARKAVYTMLPTNGSIAHEFIPELQRSQVVKRL